MATGKTIVAVTAAAAIGTGLLLTQLGTEEEVSHSAYGVDDILPIMVHPIVVEPATVETVTVEPIHIHAIGAGQSPAIGGVTVSAVALDGEMAALAVPKLDADIRNVQEMQKRLSETVRDQRLLLYDRTLTAGNAALDAWMDIYNKPLPPQIEFNPLPSGIRMIAELRSMDHAEENLAFYRQRGYNACLVAVDGSETVSSLISKVSLVRSMGMAPWLAWSGPERLEWTIFRDPAKITRLLRAAAPFCDGYLVAWRRTSAHLVEQDPHYLEHLVHQVRVANPKIFVVGESYWGQTWENHPYVQQRGWEARDNVARAQSGILIAGISTMQHPVEKMLAVEFARWKNSPRLGLVLGERAYYASTMNTGRSFETNLQIKRLLERRFVLAGCVGTVTMHGDGGDKNLSLQNVDDLGKYSIANKGEKE